jgi:hypothetical protein
MVHAVLQRGSLAEIDRIGQDRNARQLPDAIEQQCVAGAAAVIDDHNGRRVHATQILQQTRQKVGGLVGGDQKNDRLCGNHGRVSRVGNMPPTSRVRGFVAIRPHAV